MQGTAAISDEASDYQIKNSLRFNHGDSPDLRHVPTASSSRKTWTFSAWIKRHLLGNDTGNAQVIFVQGDGSNASKIEWSNDTIHYSTNTGGSIIGATATTAVFRDPSAWYHVVVAHDTTQSEASERLKIYVNGKLQALTTSNTIEQDQESHINSDFTSILGGSPLHDGGRYCAMSIADVYLIDGAALYPAAFGTFDSNTDVWNPKDPYNEDGKFTVPAPNKGVTHSSTLTSSSGWNTGAPADLFDGDTTSTINPTSGHTAVSYTHLTLPTTPYV